MSQQRLNNIVLLNVHKDLTDGLALLTIAKQFMDANEGRRHFFNWHCMSQSSETHQSDWG